MTNFGIKAAKNKQKHMTVMKDTRIKLKMVHSMSSKINPGATAIMMNSHLEKEISTRTITKTISLPIPQNTMKTKYD